MISTPVVGSYGRVRLLFVGFLILLISGIARGADPFADDVRKTEPLNPDEERTRLHVPAGFEVQLVACEPEIGKPMNMAFDARGRLWITQSREYPYAAPLDKPGRDKIKVLSDFDGDGRARKVTTFAEGLNIPIGLYPYKRGVIAFSIPDIYFFEDTNSDGKADRKELILGRFGFEKDVHGLTSAFRRGYDGWLYADHGYNNDSTLTAKDGSSIKMNSGNTYRFRLDGSHVEQFTWGQVNPFGLMFDPLGDLWSADCHSSPVYQLLRGAYYPSFGKPHDGLGFGPEICTHSHGSTAIAGMVYYAADGFPAEYRDNTFVGNVVTCRINRDSFEQHGSTRVAKEEPDFLSSDDPWFRPVDLQLGPDGALYVADFYNRIIGHYEVPLNHPGRDRERGRIWRIVYRGTNEKAGKNADENSRAGKFDISAATPRELIRELATKNIARRMLAMNELVDRIGRECVSPVKKMMNEGSSTEFQKIHGLWILSRLGELEEKTLTSAARAKEPGVRVHAMRVLSELRAWSPKQEASVLNGLKDADPYVQRAAADAAGRHPTAGLARALLDLRERVKAADSQLLHVVRMAMRDQLSSLVNVNLLRGPAASEKESREIADVAEGIHSTEAGHFLLAHVMKFQESQGTLRNYLRHIARYAPEGEMPTLARFIRTTFSNDTGFQLALFRSVEEGSQQRGGILNPAMRDWGTDLAEQLLNSVDSGAMNWHNFPVKGAETTNPWFLQKRMSADGDTTATFVCSLPPGGERLTGSLRSRPFPIPRKLAFYMAGHDGLPSNAPQNKNMARLRDAMTDEVLAESAAPRNDVAQPFTWDLSKQAGKQGYLEIVDGNTGGAYAWLAVGRIEPPVMRLPEISPSEVDTWQLAAAELARTLGVKKLTPRLAILLNDERADADARSAAAQALIMLEPAGQEVAFSNIISRAEEPMSLRAKVAEILGTMNAPWTREILLQELRTAPGGLQKEVALALASKVEGAEALLQAVSDGKASARLLQERKIRERLIAAKPANCTERIEKLTANLPAADQERQKVIETRRTLFNSHEASVEKGAQAFKTYCAICHSLDGQGALIGPQLDGVSARGADRLIEDILDPNRNVDRAFRTTLLILKDGDVQSGLFRREEGELFVLAQSNGKEISVPKKDVRERRESETSLMPDNFSDVMAVNEFNDLMAFLLSKSNKGTGNAPH